MLFNKRCGFGFQNPGMMGPGGVNPCCPDPCMNQPVMEPTITKCVQKDFCHEVPHVCWISDNINILTLNSQKAVFLLIYKDRLANNVDMNYIYDIITIEIIKENFYETTNKKSLFVPICNCCRSMYLLIL
jgi:hypothetical protein